MPTHDLHPALPPAQPPPLVVGELPPAAPPAPAVLPNSARWLGYGLLLALLVAAAALLASSLLWQRLNAIQEELARRSLDAGAQSIEARTLARQAMDGMRDVSVRLALQESRLSEVSLQRSQLEELMQSLSRSRDENLVVDMESALRLAQQQAQLTGSAEPLIAALKSADQRLARSAQPRLNPLQRAVNKDLDRIRIASLTDVPVLLLKIDELARLADELPLVNGLPTAMPGAPAALPRPAPGNAPLLPLAAEGIARWLQLPGVWLQQLGNSIWAEARQLLRVSRIDNPEAALVAPEQAFFLRENLKLRLLNARLNLLSRQTDAVRSDLLSASAWLGRYFDPASRKTQTAAQLLAQVQSQLKTSELPRLDDTMTALATAAAGR